MVRLLVLTLTTLLFLSACGGEADKTADPKAVNNKESNANANNGGKMANPQIKIETTMGDITLELDAENAPNSTKNFVDYVEGGFYDGTIFHRVIPNFMVQGGGMLPDMSEKPNNAPIKNEAGNGLKNDRGTVAMARTNDPHSATSQFFINVKDNAFLNFTGENPQGWGYAVFGKVTDGMDVVDKIVAVQTGNKGHHGDVPVEPILMNKVTVAQ